MSLLAGELISFPDVGLEGTFGREVEHAGPQGAEVSQGQEPQEDSDCGLPVDTRKGSNHISD